MKPSSKIDSVLAERELRGERPSQVAVVTIGKPQKESGHDWYCSYQITGIGLRGVRRAYGVDAVQALLIAIDAIRMALDEHKVNWTWEGGDSGDHGFPRAVPTFYGQVFARRIGSLVDREIEVFARNAELISKKGR